MDYINNEQLIEAVRTRRPIWDVTDAKYYDKVSRTRHWEDLCKSSVPEFKQFSTKDKLRIIFEVQRKWRYIRDAYTRSLRVRQTKPNGKKIRPYLYEKNLAFLNMLPKLFHDTESSHSADDDAIDNEPMDYPEDQSADEDPLQKVDILPTIKIEPEIILPIERPSTPPVEVRPVTPEEPPAKEESDDMIFFRSLLPLVEPLSLRQKMKFRIEMTKMALDFSENDAALPKSREPSASSGSVAVQARPSCSHCNSVPPNHERPMVEIGGAGCSSDASEDQL
ncbi:uncharacterized protein LOC131681228 [Topomyia yanbarensis]|uniref:uncharacterized protein LOC131681228 n=1 Tax=Topomyia yanbarensis TaxID=2498891 RepID=UPI00273BF610|nr:uncharacterized protein LOC131681228 [Topomyia yanbarensis]